MMSITPSHIIEHLFCPRYTYFEYVLTIPQYEEKFYKAIKGREVHSEKLERNKDYLRKKIGVKEKLQDQYLTNDVLRGKVDEVLLLNDDTMAPLDYKFAEYKDKIYNTYQQQLFCYAVLIEEKFKRPVHKGFIVYTRSKNKLVEVQIKSEDKLLISETIEQIERIINNNYYPKATKFKRRCLNCTYRNICIK
ncbi:CRISPR-associated protein Cas4 [Fulvivirga maritima]|uniref:CRISPR-associated protein Cas4 n=1 Tax=Fulvivirga maritima TaxID=2904247 RepID=UPI002795CCCC|nr:CRISPR-associated protein Cas4 [Fulvivirga maritima]